MPSGVRALANGIRGDRARQLRGGIIAVAFVVLLIATASLLLKAVHDRSRVLSGHASAFIVLDFPMTPWGAEDATISWTSSSVGADLLTPLGHRCLLHFGQAAGTAFFYGADTRQVLRISTMDVVVHTGPSVCKALTWATPAPVGDELEIVPLPAGSY